MQVVVLLLLVASLALLVSGLITASMPLVIASIVTSLLAAYAISRYRNRQPAAGSARARPTTDRAATSAVPTGSFGVPAGPPSAGTVGMHSLDKQTLDEQYLDEQGEPEQGPSEPEVPVGDDPPVAGTDPPLRSRGEEPVWVIDGRPRYHLEACGFLAGRDPEPVPLRQAVEDGFTPCALCDPDSGLVAGTTRSAGSG